MSLNNDVLKELLKKNKIYDKPAVKLIALGGQTVSASKLKAFQVATDNRRFQACPSDILNALFVGLLVKGMISKADIERIQTAEGEQLLSVVTNLEIDTEKLI